MSTRTRGKNQAMASSRVTSPAIGIVLAGAAPRRLHEWRRHLARSKADEASIKYFPALDVTVSAFRVGPYVASVEFHGTSARPGVDFDYVTLPEPSRAATVRVFDALVPGLRQALRDVAG